MNYSSGGRATKIWRLLEEPNTQGHRIRRWRLIRNLTQSQLAAEAAKVAGMDGLTKSFIALLEEDRTQPSVHSLRGIAAVLGVTMDYLVTGETGTKRQTPKVNLRPLIQAAKKKQATRLKRTTEPGA